jgi:hypothetical protein
MLANKYGFTHRALRLGWVPVRPVAARTSTSQSKLDSLRWASSSPWTNSHATSDNKFFSSERHGMEVEQIQERCFFGCCGLDGEGDFPPSHVIATATTAFLKMSIIHLAGEKVRLGFLPCWGFSDIAVTP